eukprot:COSAG03_NODE_2019_length_3208_cov_212.097459_2_plen_323_part_00
MARAGLASIDNSAKSAGTQALQQLRLITAVKTPFTPDGKMDLDAYDAHLEDQLANGVEGFIIGGTTGEGHLFAWDEHIMLIAHTKHKFGDRCTVIGNTGSNSTNEARHATRQGFAVGMDAALHINPYYGKTSEKGVLSHLEKSMEFGPTIVYNVPGRTGQDIPFDTMMKIADHPHFAGVKECMGRERIQSYSDVSVITWSGNDDECHETRHEAGCQGVISVTANLIPGLFSQMMKEPSYELASDVSGLIDWLFVEPNPIGVNTMMMQLGICQPVFRLPYVQYDADMRQKGKELIEAIGLEHVPGNKGCKVMADDDFIHCADW